MDRVTATIRPGTTMQKGSNADSLSTEAVLATATDLRPKNCVMSCASLRKL